MARHVESQFLEHRAVVLGLGAQRGEEVAHHHPVEPGLDRQRLQVAQVLHAPATEPEEGGGQDQAEDRDPLDRLPGVHPVAVAELGAGARVQEVDRHAGGVDLGQLEGHLHPLLARLAEVEDAADAGLEAGLLDGLDRPQATLVADGGRDLVVVALGRLDVVVHALDARVAQLLGALDRHVADRRAALEVGVLGHQLRAIEDVVEVALGEPLALGDHAEPVRARRLGRARVLEDLVGGHHRVHRRVRLREPRLRAEAAVLGAAAGLGVDQRAHVGRVPEALDPRLPRPLHQRLDLGSVLDRAERQRFVTGDERRQALDLPWVAGSRGR